MPFNFRVHTFTHTILLKRLFIYVYVYHVHYGELILKQIKIDLKFQNIKYPKVIHLFNIYYGIYGFVNHASCPCHIYIIIFDKSGSCTIRCWDLENQISTIVAYTLAPTAQGSIYSNISNIKNKPQCFTVGKYYFKNNSINIKYVFNVLEKHILIGKLYTAVYGICGLNAIEQSFDYSKTSNISHT